jgi:dihydroorotate dehydrogenase electron transfer subunit
MKDTKTKIVFNQEVAPACFRMVLSGPLDNFIIKPGQFIMLTVGMSYDPLLRRPFAAHQFKTSEGTFLEIFYQVVGYGTHIMSHMLPGTELVFLGPLGSGFQLSDKLSAALIVAGGMGIVPLRGLIYSLVALGIKNIQVFVGAKSASQLLFLTEFQKMDIPVHCATEDGSSGYRGLVTGLFHRFLENHALKADTPTMGFACGPRPMLAKTASLSFNYQLPCQVSLESRMACGIGVCLGCAVKLNRQTHHDQVQKKYGRVCLEGPVFDAKEIEW